MEIDSKNAEATEAVVAGHICIDVIPTLFARDFQFSPGKLVESGAVATSTGGSVSNTGIALHRLGISTRLMGKIGTDLFGEAIKSILESHGDGLSRGMTISPGEQTSYSIILSPPGSDRMFLHAPGCNATFDQNDIDYAEIATARLLHFGYPPLMQNRACLIGIHRAVVAAPIKIVVE